jgi:acyl phosphate:glycerol-3-phosphate acyltransferase
MLKLQADLAVIVLSYLIGSISFAVIVSRLMGLADPRSYGSKNPGATNVLRSGNKAAAVLTLIGDAFKGWIAVFLVSHLSGRFALPDEAVPLSGLAVFVGHLYPVFFRFKGGKGVATAAGVLLAVDPVLGAATLATWLIIAVFLRYSSLAALIAAIFAPLFYFFMYGTGEDAQLTAIFVMSALLIYRHRANIGNLLAGKESRIGEKKSNKA